VHGLCTHITPCYFSRINELTFRLSPNHWKSLPRRRPFESCMKQAFSIWWPPTN